MSAKNTNRPAAKPAQKPKQAPKLRETAPLDDPGTGTKKKPFYWWLLPVLVILTVVVYAKSLDGELTNWDDKGYVTDNMNIRSLHGDSVNYTLENLFDTTKAGIDMGNYHPLTMLSYAIDYNKGQLDPRPYHMTNLILHVLNTLLVFAFIWLMTKQQWVSFFTAIVFAVHPMHVESVAWIAERKDVLFSFFYLLALCLYLLYVRRDKGMGKWLYYLLGIAAFLLALFSKGMAVSLPVAFIAVDFFIGRKINWKTILEKLPFFILALIFGLIAIKAQQTFNAVGDSDKYTFAERILFTCYGIMLYLWKFIAPYNMSCFYQYPARGANGLYPAVVYLAPFLVGGLTYWIFRTLRKGRDIAFGFGFFLVTIALVLQVLPVGEAIIAERYSYLPYIGVAFVGARLLQRLWDNHSERIKSWKTPVTVAVAAFIIMLSTVAFQRTQVWHDSLTLWNDAIEKDNTVPRQYQSRGDAYTALKQYEQAVADYDRAIKLNPYYPDALYNRGIAHYYLGSLDTVAATRTLEFETALDDYNKAILYNPNIHNAFYNRGITYHSMNNFPKAIEDYKEAIRRNPTASFIHNNLGLAYFFSNDYDKAFDAYTEAIRLNPKYAEAYNNRAGIFYSRKQFDKALEDALNSQKYGYKINPKFIEELQVLIKSNPTVAK